MDKNDDDVHRQKSPVDEGDIDPGSTEAAVSASFPPTEAASTSTSSATEQAQSEDLTIAQAMHAIETLTVLYGFSSEAANEAIHHVTTNESSNANAAGGDDLVALCCDYIIDHGLGIDSGGAIAPIDDCPHVVDDAGGEPSNHEKGNSSGDNNTSCGCISVTADDVPETIFEMPCGYFGEAENDSETKKKQNNNDASVLSTAIGGFKEDIEYSPSGDNSATCPRGENWWCLKCGGIYCSRYVNGHGVKHYYEQQQQQQQKEKHCVMIGLADLSVWCHNCGSYLETHNNKRLSSILQRLQDIKFRDE
jgi:hypothetical protein